MLQNLSDQLAAASSSNEKIAILDQIPAVQQFLQKCPVFSSLGLSPEHEVALKQIIAIDQAERLFIQSEIDAKRLKGLLETLVGIDSFYREMGGIVGYQAKILQLLQGSKESFLRASYHAPSFIDLVEETAAVQEAISWGIEGLAEMAEIYPLGGAADRLHLVDEKTGVELPAAKLSFAGRTLLEHLIRDLQARERLYFQKYGVQLITPIAIMTSHEKKNHTHVLQICENLGYFGRPKESFRFFTQPLVPTVNEKGEWCVTGPLKPLLKPGGHGAIWKLARDSGIFTWLEKQGRSKLLIRQINNPIAGLDYGLLAFAGIGWKREMVFGFASCPRLLQAAEGVNVLIEREGHIVLTNIEYCDFGKFGIEDRPFEEGGAYSKFSSNTNILFADLRAIAQAVDICPFPGLLINVKPLSYATEAGDKKEESAARLESTMQNIADVFIEEKGESLIPKRTFVTYNQRHKTISTAKKAWLPGRPLQETPENCFYDLLRANRELLASCDFALPPLRTLEEYLQHGPDCLFLYHPALGPLYRIIRDKLRGGKLSPGSELRLEIADISFVNVVIEGSLQVIAEQPMGHFDEQKLLHYSSRIGRCILENVTVKNRGVDWEKSHPFWKMNLQRWETTTILLKGQSSFIARDTQLSAGKTYIVEDGTTLEILGGQTPP